MNRYSYLLNVDYKIFTKIWAKCLKEVINDCIGLDQYGFLRNRPIADPIRKVFGMINLCKTKKIPVAIMSLDLYKAFDTVNSKFILSLPDKYNLGSKFKHIIEAIYIRF